MTLIGARTAIVVSSEQKVTRRPICQRPSRPPPSQVPRAIHSVVPITSCHEGSPLPRQPGVLPFLPRLLIADFPSRNGCLFQNPHRPCQKNNTASSIYPTPACSRLLYTYTLLCCEPSFFRRPSPPSLILIPAFSQNLRYNSTSLNNDLFHIPRLSLPATTTTKTTTVRV